MKKILLLVIVMTLAIVLSSCTQASITCGEGTIAVGNTCVIDDGSDPLECPVGKHEENEVCVDDVVDLECPVGQHEENEACVDDVVDLECPVGQHEENEACVDDVVDSGVIVLVEGSTLNFNVGDTLPDFTTYFTSEGVVIDASMIMHTLLLDANNIMTSPGIYQVTITIGSEVKTVSLTVSDGSIDYSDIVEEGVAGIYVDPSQKTVFELGDYMPNFLPYFIAYDGTNYVTITPDLVLHNLLLAADNRMIAAGTFQVSVELNIGGTVYSKSIDLTVNTIGGATSDSIGSTGWEVQDSEFTDANLYDSWFIPSGDVTVTADATAGEVDVHVNTVGMNFWDVIFAQPGKTFERGYTYEITYRMKTGLSEGRDVVVFVEPSQGAAKLLEEQVSLTTEYQDFTFTFVAATNTTSGMVGVFIGANLPGAHPGSIIFDSVVITRTGEPTVDVYLNDIPNQDFTNSDISDWVTEGNVALSHNATGYLVADVSAFTGAFYQENIQLGGFSVAGGTTYTVTYVIKTDIVAGRDVTFFVEDTDAGYAKYFETTETLTTEFQTFTYTFTPTVYNQDTKIGIFVGEMENGVIGTIVIDSITVTTNN